MRFSMILPMFMFSLPLFLTLLVGDHTDMIMLVCYLGGFTIGTFTTIISIIEYEKENEPKRDSRGRFIKR